MSFDNGLAQRLNEYFEERHDLTVKKMFGGLCFLLSDHMCCAIIKDKLLARVGADNYQQCLAQPHVTEMDFTGKPIKTMVYIESSGLASDEDLIYWLSICSDFVATLAPKVPNLKNKRKNKKTVEELTG